MHIYFSGIGGTGIGPLALIAQQAGYEVSGSDKQDSNYIQYLIAHGVTNIHIGQGYDEIAAVHARKPIDWLVYTSALPMENPDAPELKFCAEQAIKHSKRDELLNQILHDKQLRLIAIAGTHGKTTTTAMMIWLLQKLELPISYLLPAKTTFAEMGTYVPDSEYFIYEADEFDRNFLAYQPALSIITGIDWDHPDIYPTREEYNAAFREFLAKSEQTVLWQADVDRLGITPDETVLVLDETASEIDDAISLPGLVNRQNAWEVIQSSQYLTAAPEEKMIEILNDFPGVSRRFEKIIPGLYSDYAHTVPKIRGALQLGHEVAQDNLVVIYEGLHNTRQHFIKHELADLFTGVKHLYIVPSYLAREDTTLSLLQPADLKHLLNDKTQSRTTPAACNDELAASIQRHIAAGDTVLCLTAGGGNSLDEWLRKTFTP